MSTLNVANVNASNSVVTNILNDNGLVVTDSISIGNVTVNSTALTVGNSVVNSSVVQVDSLVLGGTTYTGLGIYGAIVNTQIFTTNGTWTNPNANTSLGLTGNEQVLVMMWGGGGGGNTINQVAGGGSACFVGYFPLSTLPSTVSVTVGSGGTPGVTGGSSIFNNITIYGGSYVATRGGSGGGLFSSLTGMYDGGAPLGGTSGNPGGVSTFGGGGGGSVTGAAGGLSVFGGGGAGFGAGTGANSVYGGGGGSSTTATGVGGSIFGGAGANSTSNASVPGGGGGRNDGSFPTNGTGARGEVRVWVIK